MTNRERLLHTNEYDLLIKVQDRLNRNSECILDIISGYGVECKSPCENCIQKWLNEEESILSTFTFGGENF